MRFFASLLAASVFISSSCAAGVTGTAFGFAAGTTGGGNVAGQYPSSPAQLKSWLEDSTPRVILIDKEFNFKGTEGVCTNCAGCKPTSYTCGSAGQLAIDLPGQTWCDNLPPATVTYDKAAVAGINVQSNKSLVGVGANAVIRGKGLRVANGASNVIIQNVHITELNPSLIWGGDAITLVGSDKIWIDHVKISLIGRQMFVTGYDTAGHVTVSNTEFDGQTSWSASCDGHHYWTALGYGSNDLITFAYNYIHHTSGRSPKLESNDVWHAVSNYWTENTGHAFDVSNKAQAFIEGNVFENVKTTMQGTGGQVFAPTISTATKCTQYIGRECQPNNYSNAPTISGDADGFLVNMKNYDVARAMQAKNVKASVLNNAGVGKI